MKAHKPPVTKKYENKTNVKTVMGDGCLSHEGCFIFKLGTSKIRNGKLYSDSSIFFVRLFVRFAAFFLISVNWKTNTQLYVVVTCTLTVLDE